MGAAVGATGPDHRENAPVKVVGELRPGRRRSGGYEAAVVLVARAKDWSCRAASASMMRRLPGQRTVYGPVGTA